jgi:hypothetical protein
MLKKIKSLNGKNLSPDNGFLSLNCVPCWVKIPTPLSLFFESLPQFVFAFSQIKVLSLKSRIKAAGHYVEKK